MGSAGWIQMGSYIGDGRDPVQGGGDREDVVREGDEGGTEAVTLEEDGGIDDDDGNDVDQPMRSSYHDVRIG